ncbi:hypothetical protein ACUWC2_28630, partial [Klebsiella pneumoniae]|uniref:hypothetical protein n=1 Tax=Klebsiella pneumoniae TaxID=573 RepID=UPI0040557612
SNSVKIPVTIEQGDVLVPEIKLPKNLVIPESIATAQNGSCLIPLDVPNIKIHFTERIPVLPLSDSDFKTPGVPDVLIRQSLELRHEVVEPDGSVDQAETRVVESLKKIHP